MTKMICLRAINLCRDFSRLPNGWPGRRLHYSCLSVIPLAVLTSSNAGIASAGGILAVVLLNCAFFLVRMLAKNPSAKTLSNGQLICKPRLLAKTWTRGIGLVHCRASFSFDLRIAVTAFNPKATRLNRQA